MERKGISDQELKELMGEGKVQVMPDYKSLRDEIAIAVLTAIINRGDLDTEMNVMPYCKDAYTIADAMLKARESSSAESATRT